MLVGEPSVAGSSSVDGLVKMEQGTASFVLVFEKSSKVETWTGEVEESRRWSSLVDGFCESKSRGKESASKLIRSKKRRFEVLGWEETYTMIVF